MKTILVLFTACALLLFTADITPQKVEAGILDICKSDGKKSDECSAAGQSLRQVAA